MGRPINAKNFGAGPGTIKINAWVVGDSMTRTGYIVKQNASNVYTVTTAGGTSMCTLVTGAPAAAGQMNIPVYPYGEAEGSGATGAAHMGVKTAAITTAGTGGSYAPGNILTLVTGTGTAATFTVSSVKVRAGAAVSSGTGGYSMSDTITFSTGFATPAVLAVASVDGGGNITGLTVTTAGVLSATPPTNPVTPDATSGGGNYAGTTITLSYSVNAISLTTTGSYTVLPTSGARATTVSPSGGTGATITVSAYEVETVAVTAGGTDYQTASVAFGSGAATATATVTAGVVTSVAVTAKGTYTTIPSVTISASGSGSTQYATVVEAHLVKTFTDNVYVWSFQPTLLVPGHANLFTT